MSLVYLQLGSNIGNRINLLHTAILEIEKHIGIIINMSNIYESSPWGVDKQSNYLNQILLVETNCTVKSVLVNALKIENIIGRKRDVKWSARVIDIDIIFFNNAIVESPELCVPHKYMHKRNFVLIPLNEIASKYIHPIYKKNVETLLDECQDLGKVTKYEV